MIKNDFGNLHTPYYEDKNESGLNLIFIPKKTTIKSAVLYINQGFYLHDEEINDTKINYGCPFLLKDIILDKNTKEQISNLSCKIEAVCKHSYTYYKFTSLFSLEEPINILLNRIKNLDLTDSVVEKYKEILIRKNHNESPLDISKENTIHNLFIESPMKNGSIIKNSDLIKIHLTEMKKFLQRYYSMKTMSLFISGDYSPSDCNKLIDKLKFPIFPITTNKVKKFNEDYSKVAEKRSVIYLKNADNILTLGIKFEKRETLFEKYGELIFVFYEIALNLITENEKFKSFTLQKNAVLLDSEIIEGYEDTLMLLSFKCQDFPSFSNALSEYLSSINKNITMSFFNAIKKSYVIKMKSKLANPSTLIDEFARLYANNISFTYMIKKVSKFSYSDFIKILNTIFSYPRSVTYLKSEE